MVTGNLHALVSAYVRGEGITAAARAAGISVNTAKLRLKSDEAQQMIHDLRAELRSELGEWPLRVRALGERVLDAMAEVLDGEPDAATVATLARIILPETRFLLADAQRLPEPKPSGEDTRATLRAKFEQMEGRALAIIETQNAKDDLKRLLGLPVGDESEKGTGDETRRADY